MVSLKNRFSHVQPSRRSTHLYSAQDNDNTTKLVEAGERNPQIKRRNLSKHTI
jgi:hypothetical protein